MAVPAKAAILDPLFFDYYDLPSASDIAAFRNDLGRGHPGRRPSQIVVIGVAKWFGRTVAQRITRHTRDYRGGQQLVAIDLVMFLLTEGHALEHCSIEIYASHFPSFSKLCMDDLETQALDLGKTLQWFDVKYARVWDRDSSDAFRTRVSGCGANVASMSGEDWKFLRALEREWVVT
ncbi:hypothetical protein V5799_024825 [Amblyomma americanum]|uniref:Uncharacterized protein n=1 Tax=Amblyomma americanum TaxID=6943 RepID=A0AAQ4EBF8_AMBAM